MTKYNCMEEGPRKELIGCITMMSWNKGENQRLEYTQLVLSTKSIIEMIMYLEHAPVLYKSAMQRTIALSVIKAKLFAEVLAEQDLLFVYRVICH